MLTVADATDGGAAGGEDAAGLATREGDHYVGTLTRGELCEVTRTTYHLSALTRTKLDVVDHSTDGDLAQRQSVAHLRHRILATHDGLANLEAGGCDDVGLDTVRIVDQSDVSRPIGIILDALDGSGDVVSATLEVDQAELALVTTTAVADGHLTGVVATTGASLADYKGLLWYVGSNILVRTNNFLSLARSGGLQFTYSHCRILNVTEEVDRLAFGNRYYSLLIRRLTSLDEAVLGIARLLLTGVAHRIDLEYMDAIGLLDSLADVALIGAVLHLEAIAGRHGIGDVGLFLSDERCDQYSHDILLLLVY